MLKRLTQTLGFFLIWRIALLLAAVVAGYFFVTVQDFTYPHTFFDKPNNWLYSWGNFDGVQYHLISVHGYGQLGSVQAFFPVYPLLSRAVFLLTDAPFWSLFVVANFSAVILFYIWISFFSHKISTAVAWKSLLLLAIFPTAFYFGATYNESLFLLCTLFAFMAADRQKWVLAAIAVALAAGTRLVGIFLVPALLIELANQVLSLQNNPRKQFLNVTPYAITKELFFRWRWIGAQLVKNHTATIALILAGTVGLLSYMTYLWWRFGDPLYFFHLQSSFGAGRSEDLILLPQVIWRQLKILATITIDWRWQIYLQELILTLGSLAVLAYGYFKSTSVRLSWIVFSVCAILLPPLTGILSSMPRYVIVAFPIFIILAEWLDTQPKVVRYAYYAASGMLLSINTILFIQGYWVS